MTDLRQAAQQALKASDALEKMRGPFDEKGVATVPFFYLREFGAAMEQLRAALAEPEQEPVAWVEPKWIDPDTRGWPSDSFASQPIEGWLPLYTAPTPRKPQTTHWEGCEAVHPECKTELERKSNAIQRLWKERDELRSECRVLVRQNGEWQELTAELVEALRCADAMLSGANMDAKAVERKVAAALAKVGASK